jgi:microcystin-dependent protein
MMSEPYIGQISIFGFNFAPAGWAFCQGQLMPISQNVPLFEVLGSTYGGNNATFFALPNLQRIPIGAGQGRGRSPYKLGDSGGAATVTLTGSQLPVHSHAFNAVTDQATSTSPDGNQLARAWKAQAKTDTVVNFYSANPGNAKAALASDAVAPSGSGGPHNNMQPYLMLNFCIATQGVVPPRQGAPSMRTPLLGEISICAFDSPPPNWALCDGRLLQVDRNQALFSLLGISFGGDGIRTFALPDLRGRAPLGVSGENVIGQIGGEEAHVLSDTEMPSHGHALLADAISTDGIGNTPSAATVPGRSSGAEVPGNTPFTANLYDAGAANAVLGGQSIGNSGDGQAHENRMPSLVVSFCINIDINAPFPVRG